MEARLAPLAYEWDLRTIARSPGWRRGALSDGMASTLASSGARAFPFRYKPTESGLHQVEFRTLDAALPPLPSPPDKESCKLRPSLMRELAPSLPQVRIPP